MRRRARFGSRLFEKPGASGEKLALARAMRAVPTRAEATHPSAPSYDVDVALLTASGGVDATYGAGGVVSVPAEGGPVGAAQLADGRVLVWTSYGELLAIAPDGAPDSTWKLDVSGTVLAATLDASQRLVVVGMTTSDPARSMWFVRRYLLM